MSKHTETIADPGSVFRHPISSSKLISFENCRHKNSICALLVGIDVELTLLRCKGQVYGCHVYKGLVFIAVWAQCVFLHLGYSIKCNKLTLVVFPQIYKKLVSLGYGSVK